MQKATFANDLTPPQKGEMYLGSLFGYFYTTKQFNFDKSMPYLEIKTGSEKRYLNRGSSYTCLKVELHPTYELEKQPPNHKLHIPNTSLSNQKQQNKSSFQIDLTQKSTKTKSIKKNIKPSLNHKNTPKNYKSHIIKQIDSISIQSQEILSQPNFKKSIIIIDNSSSQPQSSNYHSQQNLQHKQQNNIQFNQQQKSNPENIIMLQQQQQKKNQVIQKQFQFSDLKSQMEHQQSLKNLIGIQDQIYQNQNYILYKQNDQNYFNYMIGVQNNMKMQQVEPKLKSNSNFLQMDQQKIFQEIINQTKHNQIIDFNVIFQQFWQLLYNKEDMVRIKIKIIGENKKSQKGYYLPIRIDIFIKENLLNQCASNNYYNYEQKIRNYEKKEEECKNARQQLQKLRKKIMKNIKTKIIDHQSWVKAFYKLYVDDDTYQLRDIERKADNQQLRDINILKKKFETKLFKEEVQLIKNKQNEIQKIKQNKYHLQELIKEDKNIRLFLIYLINKLQVKKINHSFIKPKTSSNSFIRWFKKLTIGINEAAKNWDMKYKFYMQKFAKFTQLKPISMINQKQNYYQGRTEDYLKYWEMKEDPYLCFNRLLKQQVNKHQQYQQQSLQNQYNQIHKLLGLSTFRQNQFNQTKALNQKLIKHFETQNIHFKQHPNPPLLKATLKPYQRQGLTWLKFRQGKIKFRDLFEQEYMQEVQQLQFQRKLSPFWQQVQLIGGQRLYINYLTGQFTKQFHEWGAIKGGILADEMGLGKTIMMLSLLADDQFDGTSLIVVPVSVLKQWKEEIKNHINEDISVFEYHNNARKRNQNLMNYKIIITTYATLSYQYHDYQQQSQLNTDKYLFDYKFKRVILDEAHNIRNQQTRQSQATLSLKGDFKWCLTGTLIQNSIEDLFSIFRFLNLEVLSEPCWWRQYVVNAQTHEQMLHTIYTVLRPVLLRRNKQSVNLKGQIILQLPQKIETIIQLEFSEGEQKVYQMLKDGIKEYFYSIRQQKKQYFIILQIINRLRQFCIHPSLIFNKEFRMVTNEDIAQALKKFLSNTMKDQFKDQAIKSMVDEEHQNQNCVICWQVPTDRLALTKCGHLYCIVCVEKQINDSQRCAICRFPLNINQYFVKNKVSQKILQSVILKNESSKTKAIFKKIQQIYQRNQKCVIFTHFLKLIDYIKAFMKEKSIGHTIINGGMDVRSRSAAVTKFRQDDECMFMIVSINAGGTGINLTMANNVMICDPWWNPSIEDQAYCRVHRIGQTKTVNVYKFIIKNSIQENILKMHDRKRKLASEVMMMKTKKKQKIQTAELIQLIE